MKQWYLRSLLVIAFCGGCRPTTAPPSHNVNDVAAAFSSKEKLEKFDIVGTNQTTFVAFCRRARRLFIPAVWIDEPERFFDDPNPLPGILPDGRRYGRLLALPGGVPAGIVPMIWDLSPFPEFDVEYLSGKTTVRFWDGTIGYMAPGHVSRLFEHLRREYPEAGFNVVDEW